MRQWNKHRKANPELDGLLRKERRVRKLTGREIERLLELQHEAHRIVDAQMTNVGDAA